jgi:hypothetical protein
MAWANGVSAFLVFIALSASARAQDTPSPSRPGPTLNNGTPAVDPTENVKALSEAANKRQDDLRVASEKLVQAQIDALEKYNSLRTEYNKELREAAVARLDSEARLRAEYTDRLLVAEAKRIDAIRAVDVNAVAVASTRAADSATVLAAQVSQSAETLRALVATTAATVATSQQQLANTLTARITTLEQAGYQQAGKQTFQDPAFADLLKKVDAIGRSQQDSIGVGAGRSDVIGWIAGALGLLIAFGAFMLNMRQSRQQAQPYYQRPRRRAATANSGKTK